MGKQRIPQDDSFQSVMNRSIERNDADRDNTYGQTSYNGEIGYGDSKYDRNIDVRTIEDGLLDDARAEQQGKLEEWGNAGVRFVGLTASNVVQTIPVLLGAATGGVMEFTDLFREGNQENFMDYVDNPATQAFDKINKGLKEAMPIYKSDETKNAGLSSAFKSEFLAELFSDGGSFALSAYLTGAGVSSLLGKAGRVGKAIVGADNAIIAEEILGAVKGTNNIFKGAGAKQLAASTIGALTESSIEAKGQLESMRERLRNDLINKKTQESGNTDIALSEEEEADIEQRATTAANANFLANLAVLSASNLYEFGKYFGNYTDDLTKLGKHIRGEAGEGLLKNYSAKELNDSIEMFGKTFNIGKKVKTALDITGKVGKVAGNSLVEGAEELTQLGIERATENYYANDASTTGKFVESFSKSFFSLADKEGIQSALGGILIGGATTGVQAITSKEPSKQEKINRALEDLKNINVSQSIKVMADNLGKVAYNNKLKDGALLAGNEEAYQLLQNQQFVNDVVTASRYGKLDDVIDSIDSFANSSLQEVKDILKSDLSLDDDNAQRTADSLGKIDRQALAKQLKEKALAISKSYQEVKKRYGHIYDEEELAFIANINANKDMIIRDRNNMIQLAKNQGFDYVDAIQSKLSNPTDLVTLEKRNEELKKKQVDIENQISKNYGQMSEVDRKVDNGFQQLSTQLTDIQNQQAELLNEIDATILIGENPNNIQDYDSRVNKAYNNFLNKSEFAKKREAGTPLDTESVGKAVAKLKFYNKALTEYTNMYNKLTGEKGKKEVADFYKRVAKIKEQKQLRDLFTTSTSTAKGETIQQEIKPGLYYKKVGKRIAPKNPTNADGTPNTNWGGGLFKQFIDVVERKVVKDDNGNIKPVIVVKNSDGQLVDYDLDDFRHLIKVGSVNKQTGESFDDRLTDEERFYAQNKGKLIKYRYKSKQGEPAKDIYGFVTIDLYGSMKLLYFDEETGRYQFTKKLEYKYKVDDKERKGSSPAFMVQADKEDYSQYLEILDEEAKKEYLTKMTLKMEDTKLKQKIEESKQKQREFTQTDFVNYVLESTQSNEFNQIVDAITDLESELQLAIDNNLPNEIIESAKQLILELSNKINNNINFIESMAGIKDIHAERLAMLERQAVKLESQINDISNTTDELDNINLRESYKTQLNIVKGVIMRMMGKAKDKTFTLASGDIIAKQVDVINKYEKIVGSMFKYNQETANLTLKAVTEGYVVPETVSDLENERLNDKQKTSLIKFAILNGIDIQPMLGIDLTNENLEDTTNSLAGALVDAINTVQEYQQGRNELDDAFVTRLAEGLQRKLNLDESAEEFAYDKNHLDETALLEKERQTLDALYKAAIRNKAEEHELQNGQYQQKIRSNDVFTHGVNIKPSEDTALPDAEMPNAGIKSISPSGINDDDFDSMSIENKHHFVFNKFMESYVPNDDDRFVYSTEDVKVDGMETLPYFNNGERPETKTIRMTLRNKKGEVVRVDANGKVSKTGKYTVTTTLAAVTEFTEGNKNRFRQQIEKSRLQTELSGLVEGSDKYNEVFNKIAAIDTMIDARNQELLAFRNEILSQIADGKIPETKVLSKSSGIVRYDGKSRSIEQILNMTTEKVIEKIQDGTIQLMTAKTNSIVINSVEHKVKIGRAYMIYDNKLYYLNVNKLSEYDVNDIVKGLSSILKGTASFSEVLKRELSSIYWGRGKRKTDKNADGNIVELDEFSDELVDEIRAKGYHIEAQKDKIVYGNFIPMSNEEKMFLYDNIDRVYESKELTLFDIQNKTENYYDFLDFIKDKYYNVNNSLLSGKNMSKSYLRKLLMNGLTANIRPNSKIQFDSIYVRPNTSVQSTDIKNKVATDTKTVDVKSTGNKFDKSGFTNSGLDNTASIVDMASGKSRESSYYDLLFPKGIDNITADEVQSIINQFENNEFTNKDLEFLNTDIDNKLAIDDNGYNYDGLINYLRELKSSIINKPAVATVVAQSANTTIDTDISEKIADNDLALINSDKLNNNELKALLDKYKAIKTKRKNDDDAKIDPILDTPSGKISIIIKTIERKLSEENESKLAQAMVEAQVEKPKGTYEISSQGDKRFSALFAKFKNGETIEERWAKAKGYNTIQEAKNKPAKDKDFKYKETYFKLWQDWADENPTLINELEEKTRGLKLTDKFAKTENNQANALQSILDNIRSKPNVTEQVITNKLTFDDFKQSDMFKGLNFSNKAALIKLNSENTEIDYSTVDVNNDNINIVIESLQPKDIGTDGYTLMARNSVSDTELESINNLVEYQQWYARNKTPNVSDKELIEYYKKCKQ